MTATGDQLLKLELLTHTMLGLEDGLT